MIKAFIKKTLNNDKSDKDSNSFSISSSAKLSKAKSANIKNSQIILENNSEFIIEDNVIIDNYNIRVINGVLKIGSNTQLVGVKNTNTNSILIDKGTLIIANNCIIQSEFCIRFGGNCFVDCYTGIMYGTEIRCDEKLSIGKYNMISYECMIYDTNTHCTYSAEKRRKLTTESFPYIGLEIEKPDTKPVIIGDDCWLGKRSVILKGVTIGSQSTVATNAVVTKSVPETSLVYGNPAVYKPKTNKQ